MNDVGLFGLGVMGKSFASNFANKGYSVSVYNRNFDVTKDFIENKSELQKLEGFKEVEDFINSLSKPRKIILMVSAGKPTDDVIKTLSPFLSTGDLILDGGNSNFKDTIRREKDLNSKGLNYLGVGISGGEEGALFGPSIMTGGSKEIYKLVEKMLEKVSAESHHGPCSKYMGANGAGHFVKMVHNGIEYAVMQSIAEVYNILKSVLELSNEEISNIFKKWNAGTLNSYLMEITHKIFEKKEDGDKYIVDLILDKAGQKGTGRWTLESALELGVPVPSLYSSVAARAISFFKKDRVKISSKINTDNTTSVLNKDELINELENTLIFNNIIIFSQGLWLISQASDDYKFEIDLEKVLEVWSGGCIIKSELLDYYLGYIKKDNSNVYLLNDSDLLSRVNGLYDSVASILKISSDNFIPCPVTNSSKDYFISMATEKLPANLIQAQRDFFGAHTYERIDRDGYFHTIWED